MRITSSSTLEEIAFIVCDAMDRAGALVVLTGGSAATVYAPQAYQSRDLDFVFEMQISALDATPVLNLGFVHSSTRGIYSHPNTAFTLEFIEGPLAVGGEILDRWATLEMDGKKLHVLTPTDSVRDRLAAAIHWKDKSSLAQAVAVSRAQEVDMAEIEAWCVREDGVAIFREFKAGLG